MRPKIICHMIASVDGRLVSSQWSALLQPLDDNELLNLYDDTAEKLDSANWMVGRRTMQEMLGNSPQTDIQSQSPGTMDTQAIRHNHIVRTEHPLAVVFDSQGRLDYRENIVQGNHLVVILSETVSDICLSRLREKDISYIFAGRQGLDLAHTMEVLGESFGVTSILLEGGGALNGAFLKARLIDEFSILIYPGINGRSGAPCIVDYTGADGDDINDGIALRHLATKNLENGFVWLRYAVERLPA